MGRKEKREHIRISTVLPVEFFLADKNGKQITPWLQGFTQDIGKRGICLKVNDLWWGFWDKFKCFENKFFLQTKLSFQKEPLFLEAGIKWLDSKKLKNFSQYKIGLEFKNVSRRESRLIFSFALFKKIIPVAVAAILILLAIAFGLLFLGKERIARKNQELVSEYGMILQRNEYLLRALEDSQEMESYFYQRKEDLNQRIEELRQVITSLESERGFFQDIQEKDQEQVLRKAILEDKISVFTRELESLKRENKFLRERMSEKEKVSAEIRKEAEQLMLRRHSVSEKVIAQMYNWIRNRQDRVRGLVLSYEGDSSMDRVCFTYDQALSVFVFLSFQDVERAQEVLNFFLEQVNTKANIYNGYFTNGGVYEYVLHSGPQAWIGLAALSYTKKTGDKRYLRIAHHVSDFLISMQDEDGGLVGGPEVDWYSTEHNLDAYAFFRVFYQLTGEPLYREKSLEIKNWISRHSYTSHSIPINRGKGDSTIATDTYAWSVTALGPETLYSLGMNPEAILEFAERNCKVTVNFERQDGRNVRVEGFDFAKARHVGRGGVISGEWTAQMVLAYEVMADYFKNKDADRYNKYLQKAHFYFNELQKMIITSFSGPGKVNPSLPYASTPFVDTGHGWRTPRGKHTGSLAATAYFLIAYKGYNPLRAEYLDISLKKHYQRAKEISEDIFFQPAFEF